MFDELLKTLRQFEGGGEISVPMKLEADADGYIDRECPAEGCLFQFKVHQDDWKAIVRDEEVFCPLCGHSAPAKSWWTHEQLEWGKQAAVAKLKGMMNDAMREDATAFNRRQPRNSFIKMSITVNSKPQELMLPLASTEPMRLKVHCEKCQCRFSVIGSAYFCPSCGYNSAAHVFEQSLGKIRGAIAALPTIKASIDDRDTAENTARLIVENSLLNAVTAFQRVAEAYFEVGTKGAVAVRRNLFQNLDEGSAAWNSAFGAGYGNFLNSDEITRLKKYFQQRHILAHREGLIDDDYVNRSGDPTYRPGQRLIVREADVLDCVDLVSKLGISLRESTQSP